MLEPMQPEEFWKIISGTFLREEAEISGGQGATGSMLEQQGELVRSFSVELQVTVKGPNREGVQGTNVFPVFFYSELESLPHWRNSSLGIAEWRGLTKPT